MTPIFIIILIILVIACFVFIYPNLPIKLNKNFVTPKNLKLSKKLSDTIYFSMNRAIWHASSGNNFIPTLLTEIKGKRELKVYDLRNFKKSLLEARADVKKLSPVVSLYVITYDGNVTANGKKLDAIIAEASEKGSDKTLIFIQTYSYLKFLFIKRIKPIGNITFHHYKIGP